MVEDPYHSHHQWTYGTIESSIIFILWVLIFLMTAPEQRPSLTVTKFAFYALVVVTTHSIYSSRFAIRDYDLEPVSFPLRYEATDQVPIGPTPIVSSSPILANISSRRTAPLTFQGGDEGVVQSSDFIVTNATIPPKNHDVIAPPSLSPTSPKNSSTLGATGGPRSPPFYNRTKKASLVTQWTGYRKMPHNDFCRWLLDDQSSFTSTDANYRILYKVNYDCSSIFRESTMGTGNWLQFVYEIRSIAALSESNFGKFIDLELTCKGGQNLDEMLPWLMGHFSSESTKTYLDRYSNQSMRVPCQNEPANLGWMLPFVRFDLRRMAIALVGLPQEDTTHPAHFWVNNIDHPDGMGRCYYSKLPHLLSEPSLISNVTLDEVVIHFRCGDIMYNNNKFFRFLKFNEYASRIDPGAKSIGIVTQPFGSPTNSSTATAAAAAENLQGGTNETGATLLVDTQARAVDVEDAFRSSTCRRVVYAMVEYLEHRFPQARVTIHNGPGETVPLAYARLIMAKQAFSAPDSTFSIFPVLASFGTGYHMSPTRTMYTRAYKNGWLHSVNMDTLGNYSEGRLELMPIPKEDGLYAKQTFHMREENETTAVDKIVEWFVNETLRFSIPKTQMQGGR
jgi:hypothetical protein